MKHVLPIFAFASVIVASCHTQPDPNVALQAYKDSVELSADTVGLAKFQAWKAQHELADINEYNANAATTPAAPAAKTVVVYTPAPTPAKATASRHSHTGTNGSGTMTSESGNTAKAPVKKGWSKAAKGAAIGGGTGAAIGAVVNKKNRALGAVIGGVVGGGVGYGVGRHIDKKDGRY